MLDRLHSQKSHRPHRESHSFRLIRCLLEPRTLACCEFGKSKKCQFDKCPFFRLEDNVPLGDGIFGLTLMEAATFLSLNRENLRAKKKKKKKKHLAWGCNPLLGLKNLAFPSASILFRFRRQPSLGVDNS